MSTTILSYSGALALQETWDKQTLFVDASGRDLHYDRFASLDHTEYNFDGGWRGSIGAFDGNVEALDTRSMAPFMYLFAPDLVLQTTKSVQGGLGVRFEQHWRLSATGDDGKISWPLVAAPDLQLRTQDGALKLEYLGPARLNFGVTAGYSKGEYSGTTQLLTEDAGLPPAEAREILQIDLPYRQTSFGLTASEELAKNEKEENARSTFSGDIDYTKRSSTASIDTYSVVTGAMRYKRWVTGKTWVQLELSRRINNFVAAAASMVDTVGTLSAKWQATYKISLAASYSYDYGALPPGNGGEVSFVIGRIDRLQTVSLKGDYEALRWLALKPYFTFEARRTNYAPGVFNDTIVGVDLVLQWQR